MIEKNRSKRVRTCSNVFKRSEDDNLKCENNYWTTDTPSSILIIKGATSSPTQHPILSSDVYCLPPDVHREPHALQPPPPSDVTGDKIHPNPIPLLLLIIEEKRKVLLLSDVHRGAGQKTLNPGITLGRNNERSFFQNDLA